MTFDENIAVRTMWGECRGEPIEGQRAVAHVLINRRRTGHWGDSLATVCMSPLQFSCWNTNDPNRTRMVALHEDDVELARFLQILHAAETETDPTHGAINYYATSMAKPPAWASTMTFCGQIGHHRFYK